MKSLENYAILVPHFAYFPVSYFGEIHNIHIINKLLLKSALCNTLITKTSNYEIYIQSSFNANYNKNEESLISYFAYFMALHFDDFHGPHFVEHFFEMN